MKRASTNGRGGFVLLMVLVAIMIVGVALTATSQRSLQATLSAMEEQKAMQRRWGMFSCQRTLLPAAPGIFEVSDRKSRKQRGQQIAFPSVIQDRIVLGGQAFDLLLADEDAKANINAIYDSAGKRGCERALSRLTGVMDSRAVHLLPSRESQSDLESNKLGEDESRGKDSSTVNDSTGRNLGPALRSWGEVFDMVNVNQMAGDDRQIAKMTKRVSLFGSGRLNVFRASDDAVLAVCNSVVQEGLAKRVLLKVRETFLGEVGLILERTVTNTEDRRKLQLLLGTSSSSFSLWMEAADMSSRQQRLAVQAPDENGTLRTIEFSFE